MSATADPDPSVLTLPLHAEEISVSRRKVAGSTVRVHMRTR